MCGLVYKSNFFTETNYDRFLKSVEVINHRGPDEFGYLFNKKHSFGHKRLSVIDISNGHQPMSILNECLIYNGEIYNQNELYNDLKEKGYKFPFHSDTLLLLNLLREYKQEALKKINGIFSFVYCYNDKIIAARDHIGVKPLYYTFIENDIFISSEIKSILKYRNEAIVDKEGLCELLGMCPSNTPGKTIYKDIYELKPGTMILFDKSSFKEIEYYNLVPLNYNLSLNDTKSLVKYILTDSIKKQIVSDVPLASFLSGGLDSSVIVGVLKSYKNDLDTYSITYEDNETDYTLNDFETSKDEDYIKYMNTNHNTISIDNNTIIDYLKTCVILRDSPGMTDIDASLFYLAKKVKHKHTVSMSGECADEIFGGYPWFYKYKINDNFPWIRNLEYRNKLINKNLNIDIKSYVKNRYEEAIKNVPLNALDNESRKEERILYYLNVKYFMTSLLLRHDRMTMGASLEVRVPFADKRLVSLLYNVPFKYKYYNNMEKALLRDSMMEYIPFEIYSRKKSPYPKSKSKNYELLIKKLLLDVLNNKDSILYILFDNEELLKLANDDTELEIPWFGQLMRKNQLRAFLYQIDYWYKEYNIKLDI